MITAFMPVQKKPASHGHYLVFFHSQEYGKIEGYTTNMPAIDNLDSDNEEERRQANEDLAEQIIRQEYPILDIVFIWD